MLRARKAILLAVIATVVTLASTVVPGHISANELGMVACENECSFLTGGWPFPFIVDGPGVSPVGTVDLLGVLLGVDTLLPLAMVESFVLWFAGLVVFTWLIVARRKVLLPRQQ